MQKIRECLLFIFIIFSFSIVSAATYSDCNVYGNCKPVITGISGDTYINNSYTNITNINGLDSATANATYFPYVGAIANLDLNTYQLVNSGNQVPAVDNSFSNGWITTAWANVYSYIVGLTSYYTDYGIGYQNMSVINTNNITANKFIGDGSLLTGISAGNSSFNQTLTELLYTPIKWAYNQTIPAITYTDTQISNNNASWTSTYNSTYAGLINNASYLSTYNSSYDAGIKWQYNQTYSGSTYNETYATWAYNQTSNLSGYVPYTGATANIDLNQKQIQNVNYLNISNTGYGLNLYSSPTSYTEFWQWDALKSLLINLEGTNDADGKRTLLVYSGGSLAKLKIQGAWGSELVTESSGFNSFPMRSQTYGIDDFYVYVSPSAHRTDITTNNETLRLMTTGTTGGAGDISILTDPYIWANNITIWSADPGVPALKIVGANNKMGIRVTNPTSTLNVGGDVNITSNLWIGGTMASAGGSANQATCWKADGKTLGYCSTVVNATGGCTCN